MKNRYLCLISGLTW